MGFMLLFSIVIALFKDIPDVKGDEQADVVTFSVRFGQVRAGGRGGMLSLKFMFVLF